MTSTATKSIMPAPDRRARYEDGRLLPPGGDDVIWSTYWQRRLDDGDVIETEELPSGNEGEES